MTPHPHTYLNTHAKIVAETNHAYANLLLHVCDPWTGHCFRCDEPGPCSLLKHWLDRLAALEAANETLHDREQAAEPEAEAEGGTP